MIRVVSCGNDRGLAQNGRRLSSSVFMNIEYGGTEK